MNTPPSPRSLPRLHLLVDHWARHLPDAPALRDPWQSLSYGGLAQAVEQTAERLARLGVRGGDRVPVISENCVAACVLALALSRLDAWLCLVNARLSPREVDGCIEHAGARLALYTCHVSEQARQHAERRGARALGWPGPGDIHADALARDARPEPVHNAARDQVAALVYTSGTSGAPKGVMLTHANLLFNAAWACQLRQLAPGDALYAVLPIAHVIGLASQLLGTLAGGAALVLEPRFRAGETARALAEDGITLFAGVPAMFAKLLEHAQASGAPLRGPALRYLSASGAPLTARLKAETEAAFGLPLHNGYGMTEASSTIAQTRPSAPRADCAVGPLVTGVEARIVGPDGSRLPVGEVGELHVRGPGTMLGYYRDPALSAAAVDAEGWLNTGDLARIEADGALHVVGRSKELIIRSGFNVYPVEVEQVINSHPDVVQSAVVGRSVADNEEVVAFVELNAAATHDPEAFRAFLRARLSPYKVPTDIRYLKQLPTAPTGKLLKSALKTLAQEGAPDAAPAA